MTEFAKDPGWERLSDAIDAKFGVISHGRRNEALEDRTDLTQSIIYLDFEKDGQTYRVERTTHPAIVDRKSIYHKAAGSGVRFENIYDTNDVSHKTAFFRQNGDDWEPIEASELAL